MANVDTRYAHSDITGRIIKSAMAVHGALVVEMTAQGLEFSREHEMKVYYRGVEVGTRRVDFFVEESVMVEIKAVVELDDAHLAQAKNYLEAYGLQVGMLLNFGVGSLQYKRVMLKKV